MHTFKAYSFLAVAGSALAAPWGEGNYWKFGGDNYRGVATATATATAYTTVTAGGNFFGGHPTATFAATTTTTVAVVTTTSEAEHHHQSQNFQPAASTSAAAAPASSDTSSSDSGSGGDYMSIVNEWRSKLGVGELTHSDTLEANALKTVDDDKGTMTHELNPGSMAQVLAPGDAGNFENVFVGGWLCEEPNLSGLDGICSSMSAGWDYEGQTGHADILKNPSYTKIGCALAYGLWGCDLA